MDPLLGRPGDGRSSAALHRDRAAHRIDGAGELGQDTVAHADQRAAGAALAILVSKALPKEVDTFGFVDGIWVADFALIVPLAIALRQSLIEVAGARQAREGQATKMELVYQYLTGPKFRHRVEAIAEKFTDMQADLDRERKTMTRLWAKREAQISSRRRIDGRHVRRLTGNRRQSISGDRGTGNSPSGASSSRATSITTRCAALERRGIL